MTTTSATTTTSTSNSSMKRPGVFKRRQTIATLTPATSAVASCTGTVANVSQSVNSSSSDLTPTAISGLHAPEDARRSRGSLRHQQRVRSPTSVLMEDTECSSAASGTQRGGSGRRSQGRHSGGDVIQHQSSSSLLTGHGISSIGQQQQQQGQGQGQGHRRLGRTPSSPSVLFSRVKERIREKVGKEYYLLVYGY